MVIEPEQDTEGLEVTVGNMSGVIEMVIFVYF